MYSDRATSPSIRRRSATVAAVPMENGEMQYGAAMGSKMTPKGDKFSWLGKTGIVKDVSKSQEAKSQGHASPTSVQPDGHPNPAMVEKSKPAPMNNERSPGKDTAASRTRSTKAGTANIEGNESAMYEKLEKKSLTSLKHGGSEKELREGHNEVTSAPMAPKGGGTAGPVASSGYAGYQGPRAPQPMAKEKHGMKTPKLPKAPKTLREGHNTGAPGPKERGGKVEKVMKEFKAGSLKSGSKHGPPVKSRKQAIAIGLSEARKQGENVAKKK